MGFIKAFAGAIGGTFADAWKDYYVPMQNVPSTVAIFRAVKQSTNNERGENTKGSEDIITNGSKFVVPEGTALVTGKLSAEMTFKMNFLKKNFQKNRMF